MRTIYLEDFLKIRFPGQDDRFAAGVEVGILAALMASGAPVVERRIGLDNIDQARSLARKLGYHLSDIAQVSSSESVVTLRSRAIAPKLRLVRTSTLSTF